MQIEIFEIKGFDGAELSTELDVTLIDLHKKYGDELTIRKINVLDKGLMKKHKDVSLKLKNEGIECLPLVKLNGKLVVQDSIEKLLRRY